jgi:adenylate kinase family enzyme
MAERASADGEQGGPAIFIIGPPGGGKTSVARLLGAEIGAETLHGGELLRELAARRDNSSMSLLASRLIDSGAPIPVPMYCAFAATRFSAGPAHPMIFDGFPRTLEQCLGVPEVLRSAQVIAVAVVGIRLVVAAHVLAVRLGERNRPDDADHRIRRRRQDDFAREAPLIEQEFTRRWPLLTVNGGQPVTAVVADVRKRLSPLVRTGRR